MSTVLAHSATVSWLPDSVMTTTNYSVQYRIQATSDFTIVHVRVKLLVVIKFGKFNLVCIKKNYLPVPSAI